MDYDFLATWPHLTKTKVSQHIRAPTATILGHMDHQRKNKLSTKKINQSPEEIKADIKPEPATTKSNKVYVTIYENSDRIFTDQTGKFLYK